MMRTATTAVILAQGLGSAMAANSTVDLCGKTYEHKWITKTSMNSSRSDMTATTVGDKIYLIGGCAKDQTWTTGAYPGYACGGGLPSAITNMTTAYSPNADKHVALAEAPRGRYRHAAAEVGGKIYLFGGTGGDGSIVYEVDIYDIAGNSWTTLADNFKNATTDNSAFAYGGKIYVAGGYDPNWSAMKTVWVFDPTKTGDAAWSTGPAMQQGRGDFAAVIISGSAFALGGFHEGNNFEQPLATLERLDISAGATSWQVRKSMDVARGDKAVAAINGALHVVGGEGKNTDGHSVPMEDVEVYAPDCNTWTQGGNIPTKRFRFTAAAHGESIFIFGGQGFLSGTYGSASSKYPVLSAVEEYSETVRAPVETPDAAAPRAAVSFAATAVLAGAILA